MSMLLSSWSVKGVTVKNRLVRSATWEGLADEDGAVTDPLVHIYEELARNGIALIITGFAYIRPDGRAVPGQMGIYDDGLVKGLMRVTQAAHKYDCPIFCQVVHAGLNTKPEMIGGKPPLAASAGQFPGYGLAESSLSTEEIGELVHAFAAAALRAKKAGFDGVQLHLAHGYLLSQFLSPLTNRRTDGYGGDTRGRARFPVEATRAVREAVGPDYPVAAKMNGADFAEGGLSIDQAVLAAGWLVEAGLDLIEVSAGCPASGGRGASRAKIVSPEEEGYLRPLARAVKQAVDVPVVTVGGYRSREVIEDVLASGDADAVAISRPLICEPELPARWASGDLSPSRCAGCQRCFKTAYRGALECLTRTEAAAEGAW